jgi:hypothetical protein
VRIVKGESMKAWSIIGILAVGVFCLSSSPGYGAWWVSRETTDVKEYETGGGEGTYDKDAVEGGYFDLAWALAWVEIDYTQENTGAAAYAYRYWTETITDYDPERDPPLVAHVSCLAYASTWAAGELEYSDYWTQADGYGYASGYSAEAYVEISSAEDGDIDTDWFDEDIDIYQNGYPIYLRKFAYASASAFTTSDWVTAHAYGESDLDCVVEQNP